MISNRDLNETRRFSLTEVAVLLSIIATTDQGAQETALNRYGVPFAVFQRTTKRLENDEVITLIDYDEWELDGFEDSITDYWIRKNGYG